MSTGSLAATGQDTLVVGIDIGGTFTDVCVLMPDGAVRTTKVSSTPPDFEQGFLAGIAEIAADLGLEEGEFLRRVGRIGHGTTVATNALITRDGSKVGLLSTAGHGEAISIMRGGGRTAGLGTEEIAAVKDSTKPEPFVELGLMAEVQERVDKRGDEIVALDEAQTRATIQDLIERGAESFAVCLLWSVRNPAHEQRVAELISEIAGTDTYVTVSSGLSNRPGEYERTVAAVLNSFVADRVTTYLDKIVGGLSSRAFGGDLVVMQSSGGVATIDRLVTRPLSTFQSGPVAGVIAGSYLGEAISSPNLIAGDMGGTSFDVAIIVDGDPEVRTDCVLDQYSFHLPTVDVRSIGAGGGSIAYYDELSESLRVGPASAGARPGPACYGRGGTKPTVTDACLAVGFLDAEYFLGGRMQLDVGASQKAIAALADQLGMSPDETAGGILAVVEHQMADLIRGVTVARGYDPRDFDLLGYGGAGPLHAANLAQEIGTRSAIVPQASAASAWSALGVAAADLVTRSESSERLLMPFDRDAITRTFAALDDQVRADLKAAIPQDVGVVHEADVQYGGQIHQVSISVSDAMLDGDFERLIVDAFTKRYAALYGDAATLPGTPIEILACRSVGRRLTPKPAFLSHDGDRTSSASGVVQQMPSRSVYWPDLKKRLDTPVFRLEGTVSSGVDWPGPCIVEMPQTTVVVPSGFQARTDALTNIVIEPRGNEGTSNDR